MRWSVGPWVALCLTTGCSDFAGADSEATGSGASGEATGVSTSAESSATAVTATSASGTAPATTGTSNPATDTNDSADTTTAGGNESTDSPGTTSTTDATDSGSTAAPAACDNTVMDGDETDVDCGGSCDTCGLGQGCDAGTDCATAFCAPSSTCELQQPMVWLDALDDGTLFNDDECSNSPATDGQQVYCWTNKGTAGGLFLDEGGQPNYREQSDGVEFSDDSMVSESNIFGGALGDVSVFLVQEETDSRNSYDFNLNHPEQGGERYSSHIPWGNSDRRVIFDIGGSNDAARVATAPDPIAVHEIHLFSFVNSADADHRLIFVDGAQEASEAGALSSEAGTVSLGNGNRVILHEFRVYSPAPSGAQRQVIEGQLACRWGLRDELPATHPYYDPDGESPANCPPSL